MEERHWSGGHPRGPERVWRPSRKAGRGWEAHPVDRDGSRVPPEGSKCPPGEMGEVGRPSWWAWKGRADHSEGQEGSGGVGRCSWRARWGRDALLEGREKLGGPPGGPRRVGLTTRRARKGRNTHMEGWEGSGGPPGGPGGVGRAGRGREALTVGRQGS